jgi:hypothetical protein
MIPRRWFFDALRDVGYIEGENLIVEYRFAERAERPPELAAQRSRCSSISLFPSEHRKRWYSKQPLRQSQS